MSPDAAPAPISHPARWRWWVGTAGGVVLGVVLLVAAGAKALDPAAFADQIRLEGVAFLLPAGVLRPPRHRAWRPGSARRSLLGVRRLWVLGPAALLTAFFLFLSGRNWWLTAHGLRDPARRLRLLRQPGRAHARPRRGGWTCCSSPSRSPSPSSGVARRGGAAGAASRPCAPPVATAAAAGAAVFAWQAPTLPLDDLATRLRPGREVADLCAGGAGPGASGSA